MDFIFDLLILTFFGCGDADVCHSLLCLSVSGFIFKDPCFVTRNHVLQEISVTLDPFQKMKTQRPSNCPSVRLSGFWEQFSHAIFSWLIPVLKSDGP